MILGFTGFEMLNESFKSSTISKLFNDGELKATDDKDKALFNQVKEDEIIGIADTEDDAKKMLHDALGDKNETRYKMRRVWYRVGPDDWDDDVEEDPNSAYTVNATVEEYTRWIFPLTSGKYLVLAIDKDKLDRRYYEITHQRWDSKNVIDPQAELKRKFAKRKKFVEEHKEDLEQYKKFKQFLEDKGLWDEYVKAVKEKLDELAEEYSSDEDRIERSVEDRGIFNSSSIDIDEDGFDLDDINIGDYTIQISTAFTAYCEFDYEGGDDGDYWTPPTAPSFILDSVSLDLTDMSVYVYDNANEEELFNFIYDPLFDKKNVINFS